VISGGGYTHPTYTAQTPTLTGANVLATFSSDATGHITALTTRTLAASDIGAQATLVSGTNIKTINGASILGTGDIVITGGSGLSTAYLSTRALNNADDGDAAGVTAHFLTSGAINKPTGENFSLLTLSYDADWATQLAGDWRTNKFHTRTQTTGAWTSWQTLATESWVTANFSGGGGTDTLASVTARGATTTADITTGLLYGSKGVSRFSFNEGNAAQTPSLYVLNTNTGGKAGGILAGTGGAGFCFDNSGVFVVLGETKTAFTNNALGSGSEFLTVYPSGNVKLGGGADTPGYKFIATGGKTAVSDLEVNGAVTLPYGASIMTNQWDELFFLKETTQSGGLLGLQGARPIYQGKSNGSWGNIETLYHTGNLIPFVQNTSGLVPNPGASYSGRFLREDGTWQVVSGGGGGGTVTSVDTAAANNGVTATWTNTTTTPRLTIGLGIITPTRVRLTSSVDPGIEFGNAAGNAKINSVDNNNLILRASSLRIGMGTAGWNYDEWAGIKWDNTTRTLFIGGPQAGATYWAKNGGDLNDTTVNFVGMLNDGLKVNGNKVFHGGNLGNFNQNTTGLVPAPIGTYSGRYLREDGTWQTVGSGGSVVETDTLASVTSRGNTTSSSIVINRNNGHLFFQENSVNKWHLESSGNRFYLVQTGVKNMLDISGSDMTVAGQLYTTNTHATSDVRLKTSIEDLEYGLEHVLKLRAVSFERKESLGIKELGVIAQEIKSVIPELVSTNKDGILSVNYAQMTSVLIKSDQELYTKVKEQEQRIIEQQLEMDGLKQELHNIKELLKNLK
jgi:hypothetical protein